MRCPHKVAAFIMKLGKNADELSLDLVAKCDMEKCGSFNRCFNIPFVAEHVEIAGEQIGVEEKPKKKKDADELPDD